jgi:hydrogenase nickel incorporation protein HypA/HybF
MHEMSVAMNIVDIALDTARQNQAKKINQVVLDLGTLSGIMRESLEFCFSSVCAGTIAEGCGFLINTIPAQAICSGCQTEFEADQPVMPCPSCGEMVFEMNGGREMRIRSINID